VATALIVASIGGLGVSGLYPPAAAAAMGKRGRIMKGAI
jgi:hypothetical protein